MVGGRWIKFLVWVDINKDPTIWKTREFCKGISWPEKSQEKCMLVLYKYGKQFDKNSALHHVETNAIGANKS